jgi:hypothetical protein
MLTAWLRLKDPVLMDRAFLISLLTFHCCGFFLRVKDENRYL